MRLMRSILFVCLMVGCASCSMGQPTSQLWGRAGEKWRSDSRLPDFSFCGYRSGESAIPNLPVRNSVKDFGAIGDGTHDDTAAFKNAIAATHDGALLVPRGTYLLDDVLELRRGNLVLRGEEQANTLLVFKRGLAALGRTKRPDGKKANWSWEGGLIWAIGQNTGEKLADVSASAARGTSILQVSSTAGMKTGQFVCLVMTDGDQSLCAHLHGDRDDLGAMRVQKDDPVVVRLVSRIKSVLENAIELERPLRTNVQKRWNPRLEAYSPTIQEIGLENFTIVMPNQQYERHWKEAGNNAIQFDRILNGWIRNITIRNADSGIFLEHSVFCTVSHVTIDADRQRLHHFKTQGVEADFAGHHGIQSRGGGDNLVTNFDFRVQYVHDLTVEQTAGSVFCDGAGVDLNMDHHTNGPYENLFTNLDLGRGTRAFSSSGSIGPSSGARETFWNLRSQGKSTLPRYEKILWPMMNLVGVPLINEQVAPEANLWIESSEQTPVWPLNLYRAQLDRRMKREHP